MAGGPNVERHGRSRLCAGAASGFGTITRAASHPSSGRSRRPHRVLGFIGNRRLALAHDGAA